MAHAAALVAGGIPTMGADHALGERLCRLVLAGAGRTHEEVGVGEAALRHCGGKEIAHARLVGEGVERGGRGRGGALCGCGAHSRSSSAAMRRAVTASFSPAASTTRTRAGSSDARRR